MLKLYLIKSKPGIKHINKMYLYLYLLLMLEVEGLNCNLSAIILYFILSLCFNVTPCFEHIPHVDELYLQLEFSKIIPSDVD